MPEQLNTVEFMDGAVYSVGDRVLFTGLDEEMEATVVGISDRKYTQGIKVHIQVDEPEKLPARLRYPLDPEKYGAGKFFEQPRDHGVPGGHLKPLPTPTPGM